MTVNRTQSDKPPIETWVFDLDNTLYPATLSLFPQIDVRMRRFIAERLKMSEAEAHALQKRFYHEFGTTLRGLMLVHDIEPDVFLDYVHDVDHRVLTPDPRLDRALKALEGRKLIFTNGTESHAAKVLDRLGLAHHFEAVFDIRAALYLPKPDPETYQRMVDRHAIQAPRAAMVEDIARNLKPAADLGMTTVWVRPPVPEFEHDTDTAHVDHVIEDLAAWLAARGHS
ncbi:MAG: pyrimidine 5'-nucleotidase [Rhodospirillales bacterium]|nr:pyrimidine 5'-nucleotidase [Rhodospirillales bacterium]